MSLLLSHSMTRTLFLLLKSERDLIDTCHTSEKCANFLNVFVGEFKIASLKFIHLPPTAKLAKFIHYSMDCIFANKRPA